MIEKLEESFSEAIECYRLEAVCTVDDLADHEESEQLINAIENMNKQTFYVFRTFKNEIIKYLKEVQ